MKNRYNFLTIIQYPNRNENLFKNIKLRYLYPVKIRSHDIYIYICDQSIEILQYSSLLLYIQYITLDRYHIHGIQVTFKDALVGCLLGASAYVQFYCPTFLSRTLSQFLLSFLHSDQVRFFLLVSHFLAICGRVEFFQDHTFGQQSTSSAQEKTCKIQI